MSFKTVLEALQDTLQADATLIGYCESDQIIIGWKESLPRQGYTIILDPQDEEELSGSEGYESSKNRLVQYNVDAYFRVIFPNAKVGGLIIGYNQQGTYRKGVLEFVDDARRAIRSLSELGYSRNGSSQSTEMTGPFVLSASERYLKVTINSKTPTGYDAIDCGTGSLTGSQVAINIQTSLRALGSHADDGFFKATCTYSDSKFTITSPDCGPNSTVTVEAAPSNDCSALLGFDDPTELVGRQLTRVEFGTITVNNDAYPVRYRIMPIRIVEEINF